jgi:hypothetical protein
MASDAVTAETQKRTPQKVSEKITVLLLVPGVRLWYGIDPATEVAKLTDDLCLKSDEGYQTAETHTAKSIRK